jgi:bacterioferritin-associated ferredoxin
MNHTADTVRQMPATNATELKARMVAAGSGFGAECPKCGGDVAPILLANWGHCLACKDA